MRLNAPVSREAASGESWGKVELPASAKPPSRCQMKGHAPFAVVQRIMPKGYWANPLREAEYFPLKPQ